MCNKNKATGLYVDFFENNVVTVLELCEVCAENSLRMRESFEDIIIAEAKKTKRKKFHYEIKLIPQTKKFKKKIEVKGEVR